MPARRPTCRLAGLSPVAAALLAVFAIGVPPARAAHPLQTEDTGTQGRGNLELEDGFQRTRAGTAVGWTWQPQLSVGLASTVDVIVQPGVGLVHADGAATARGSLDTNLDAKWRFAGADPWSFALRAGLELPTAASGLGLRHGHVGTHALLVGTWDAAPDTFHANLGLVQAPLPGQRTTTAVGSAAWLHQASERWLLTVDAQLTQDPDPRRRTWPGDVLAGAIWTARPGLDLDLGWETTWAARPPARTWLAGVTWRFAAR